MPFSCFGFGILFLGLICKTVWSRCPAGWQDGVNNMCYIQMVNSSDFVSWGYANAQCKRMHDQGRLPVFKDATSWNVFTMGVKQINAQLMAQGTAPPGPKPSDIIPFGAYKLNDVWYWVDGTLMSDGANNWQMGQPNGTRSPQENCVGFDQMGKDDGYGDIPCNLLFGYVCQMDPAESVGARPNFQSLDAVMSPPSGPCPAGWMSLEGVCYQEPSVIPMMATPDDGLAACAKLNPKATLPEFYNYHDYDNFIRQFSSNVEADHQNIALGLRWTADAKLTTTASWRKTYYTNFGANEPSGQECVYTNDIHGFVWQTLSCDHKGYIYCQLDTRTIQTIRLPPPTTPNYPDRKETTRKYAQPYTDMVNNYPRGYPMDNMGNYIPQQKMVQGGSSDAALISSLDTFNKYLSQSYTEEEAFGRSVASQLKMFSTALKSDTMYEIQRILSMKTKEIW